MVRRGCKWEAFSAMEGWMWSGVAADRWAMCWEVEALLMTWTGQRAEISGKSRAEDDSHLAGAAG